MDTTLEMQIKTTGEQTLKVLKDLNGTMTGLVTTLGKVKSATSGIENLGKVSDNASKKVDKLNNAFGKLFTLVGVRKLGTKALDFLGNATNRAEELNLFNVIFKNIEKNGVKTFSDLGLEATRFQHKLNESFGTNMTETMRYQGLYQAMATNQGIGEEYAKIMSENMLKLTYDLASLYNASESKTAEALRSGVFTGQVKPLRSFGVNVTEKSLNPVLASLGITDRTVSEMNQAEKQILRYIATLNQSKSAMGDFAETIESPANQLKIFKQQLVEAKTALGNLFMGVYSEVLPYANAFLMVVKEVAQAIADMFGIQASDYNSGLASQEEAFEGIEESAGNAAKSAKELKRQLLKFDEVNNLTTPSSSGSGSGSGLNNGGIDKRLLEAIKGYDNLMSKVRMKATEIRDRWMEILGFKKVINPLTGEVNFKYQGLKTTLKNLVKAFLGLNPQAKIFTSLLAGITVTKIISGIVKLSNALGVTGLTKNIIGLFTPLKALTSSAKEYWKIADEGTGVTTKLSQSLKYSIDDWYEVSSGTEKLVTGLKGIGANIGGMFLFKNAMEDISQSGANFLNVAEGIGGAFATIFGGIQTGAAIGGTWGAVIGGIIGTLELLITSLSTFKEDYGKELESINNYSQGLIDKHQQIRDELASTIAVPQAHEALLNELQSIVDKNGKIKTGYEDRAKFITTTLSQAYGVEITITENTIDKIDEKIKKIQALIDKRKVEIALEKGEEAYNLAMDNKAKSYQKLIEAKQKWIQKGEEFGKKQLELYNMWNNLTDAQKKNFGSFDEYAKVAQEYDNSYQILENDLYSAEEAYKKAKDAYGENTKAILNYQGLLVASTEENTDDINYYLSELEKSYYKNKDNIKWTLSEQLRDSEIYYQDVLEKMGESEENITEKVKAEANSRYNATLSALTNSKNYINGVEDEYADAWFTLSEISTDRFMDNFKNLPSDVQQQVVDKMQDKGYAISDELQKGIKKINPTITVDANVKTSSVKKQIRELLIAAGLPVPIFFKEKGGIFNDTSWSTIPQYANGGMPSHGTLFAAGENGAEIVGNINRRTEVLNRSQIASAIYNAVASAMSQYGGGTTQVELIAHTDEGVVIDRINQKTKQTGVCPINIPSY